MSLYFLLKIPLVSNWLVWQKAPQGLLWINAINGERFNGLIFMLSCCSIFSPAFFTSKSLCNSLAAVSAPSAESGLSSRTSLFLCPSPSTVELGGTPNLMGVKKVLLNICKNLLKYWPTLWNCHLCFTVTDVLQVRSLHFEQKSILNVLK